MVRSHSSTLDSSAERTVQMPTLLTMRISPWVAAARMERGSKPSAMGSVAVGIFAVTHDHAHTAIVQ